MNNKIRQFKNLFSLFNKVRNFYDRIPTSISEKDFENALPYLNQLKEFNGVGINCYYVANLRNLSFLDVGGCTRHLLGYEPDEIKRKNFAFSLKIFPVSNLIEIMKGVIIYHQYVHKSEFNKLKIKASIILNVKNRNGTVFKGLLQAAPFILDAKGNIAAMFTSITDVSHFRLPEELVKIDIIDESNPEQIKLINIVDQIITNSTIISKAELKVLKCLQLGKSTKEIAEDLCLSEHTITTHRKNMMNKLGTKNTAELICKTMHIN